MAKSPFLRKLFRHSSAEFYPSTSEADRIRWDIITAYRSPITQWYCRIRFHIINSNFLDTIEQLLGPNSKILDIGCGFGLFDSYFALRNPSRRVYGIDLSEHRILEAKSVALRLNISNVSFHVGDATNYQFEQAPFDTIITLDLLHHIPRDAASRLVIKDYDSLAEGGIILIKDVNVRPAWKMLFTYILDKVMDFRRPVHYRHAKAWRDLLMEVGFDNILVYYLNDYLPYPHVLLN